MLKIYGAVWCPHCTKTSEYLKKKNIDFDYFEMEKIPQDMVNKIIEVNGGDDWVIPTLEFKGKWREGKVFDESTIDSDLKKLGVI